MKIIAGPCAIEGREHFQDHAYALMSLCNEFDVDLTIKGSFDKANRTAHGSKRGVGMALGLDILAEMRETALVKVTTDVHETWQVMDVAQAVDLIQIPAFLGRQTDLLAAAGASGTAVNLKRPQFSSLRDLPLMIEKVARGASIENVSITFRGLCGGPSVLTCDIGEMVGTALMAETSYLDITHTNRQLPHLSGAMAKVAAPLGFSGIFAEVHPDPKNAICDAQHQLTLEQFREVLEIVADARKV